MTLARAWRAKAYAYREELRQCHEEHGDEQHRADEAETRLQELKDALEKWRHCIITEPARAALSTAGR